MSNDLIILNSNGKQAQLDNALFLTNFSDELDSYYRNGTTAPSIDLLISEINNEILPSFLPKQIDIQDIILTIEHPENALALQLAFSNLLQVRRQINLKVQIPNELYTVARKSNLIDKLISDLSRKAKENSSYTLVEPMSISDSRNYYDKVKMVFNDKEDIENAVNINTCDSLSIDEINQIDELKHFFGLDEDGPYSEFLNKGLKSLRPGFYIICDEPFYNISISPPTYSANVLYFHPDHVDGGLIKYEANVGPLTNIYARYGTLPGTPEADEIEIRNEFVADKQIIGSSDDHYLIPKRNFYNKLFMQKKTFFILESIFDPDHMHENPKPKRVTWSFIDY